MNADMKTILDYFYSGGGIAYFTHFEFVGNDKVWHNNLVGVNETTLICIDYDIVSLGLDEPQSLTQNQIDRIPSVKWVDFYNAINPLNVFTSSIKNICEDSKSIGFYDFVNTIKYSKRNSLVTIGNDFFEVSILYTKTETSSKDFELTIMAPKCKKVMPFEKDYSTIGVCLHTILKKELKLDKI